MKRRFMGSIVILALLVSVVSVALVRADGTETLGTPSITIESGSGIVAAGTGLIMQPGTIDIDVPVGATVKQVLLYWEGQSPNSGDDTITVDSNPVTGTLIGGPTLFFSDKKSSTFRADITGLGLVGPGSNSLEVAGLSFGFADNGAGVLVIFDDDGSADVQLRDGNDLAFINFAPPLDTTVPQTYSFAPASSDRTATLAMFFSSVAGTVSTAGPLRPTTIEITVDATLTQLINVLDGSEGEEWNTLTVPVNIPAGKSSLTVQALSQDDGATGELPASFAWNAAALSVPGLEGCTPGYWKQPQHFDSWTDPFDPSDPFSDHFEDAFPSMTLLEVLKQGGGGLKALGRHTVAALLNAASPDVAFAFSPAEVIDAFNDVFEGSKAEYTALKNQFATENEKGCPIN